MSENIYVIGVDMENRSADRKTETGKAAKGRREGELST